MASSKSENTDIKFMKIALNEAQKAFEKDEVPIGAVVIDKDNKVLSKAFNLTETKKCQSGHAEILAIEKACKKINNWRLNGCTIFITLEPCAMCMNLILLSRIRQVVFGCKSKLFGFALDKYNHFELYNCPMFIRENVLAQESLSLLQKFFKQKRKQK